MERIKYTRVRMKTYLREAKNFPSQDWKAGKRKRIPIPGPNENPISLQQRYEVTIRRNGAGIKKRPNTTALKIDT